MKTISYVKCNKWVTLTVKIGVLITSLVCINSLYAKSDYHFGGSEQPEGLAFLKEKIAVDGLLQAREVGKEVKDVLIAEEQFKDISRNFLQQYIDLLIAFPRSFFPYKILFPYKQDMKKQLLKSWCKDRLESLCNKNEDFFAGQIDQLFVGQKAFLKHPSPLKNMQEVLTILQKHVDELRALYKNYSQVFDKHLASILTQSYPESLQFEQALASQVYEHAEVTSARRQYQKHYRRLASHYPERLLFSHTLMQQVEGLAFSVEPIDLYMAVQEVKERLQEGYVQTLALAAWRPAPRAGSEQVYVALPLAPFLAMKLAPTQAVNAFAAAKHAWPRQSQIFFKEFIDNEHFRLFQRYHNGNAYLARLLNQGAYQRAIWQLRQSGLAPQDEQLEAEVSQHMLASTELLNVKPLGGGVSHSLRLKLPGGLDAVYKPREVFRLKPHRADLFAHMTSDFKKERAAFLVDKMLGLNMVPLTVVGKHQLYRRGSLQLFVGDSYNARFLAPIDPSFPIKNFRLYQGRGRVKLPPEARLFDWLISNKDRHLDNYMLQYDGTFVLIDHGYSFLASFFVPPSKSKLESMRPPRAIQKRLLELRTNTDAVLAILSPLLGDSRAKVVCKKIHYYSDYLETHTQA